jgi:RHH-type transcriptional regulator, rel operon repressor / antitoxin RelB
MFMTIYVYSGGEIMLAVRLPADIENRLDTLARKTGRTKTFYVREAILEHIEDLEEAYVALDRLKKPAKRLSMEEVERKLGLEG